MPAERLDDLQGDADARQRLVRVGAIVTLRIDDRQRLRQFGVGFMMVGDDQIDTELARAARRVGAADAAVDRDDERHAFGVESFDGHRLQAVSVAHALGNEMHDVPAEHLQRAPQNHGRGDAVDVVIAVDRNPFLPRHRGQNAIDGHSHVGQRHRIVQVIE